MEIIQLDKDRGAQIRPRTKWIEEGKQNKIFLQPREKQGEEKGDDWTQKNNGWDHHKPKVCLFAGWLVA